MALADSKKNHGHEAPLRSEASRVGSLWRQGSHVPAGVGDCLLITLPRTGGDRPYYIMIDCGVILGTADPGPKMTEVIDNIVAVTGGQIDLLDRNA